MQAPRAGRPGRAGQWQRRDLSPGRLGFRVQAHNCCFYFAGQKRETQGGEGSVPRPHTPMAK